MGTPAQTRNRHALAWALAVILLLGMTASARHHLEMLDHSPGGSYLTWTHALGQEMPDYFFWGLVIPVAYLFVRRLERRHWTWPRLVLAHSAFGLGVVIVAISVHAIVYGADPRHVISSMFSTQAFAYAAILGAVLAFHYSQAFLERQVAAGELATELAEARLSALQAQLRPHFMFNALNSVAMLVRSGRGAEAVDTIARVSDLLREGLDDDDRAEWTLEEEVALARRYLAIEEVRFADRLQVRVDLAEAARAVLVPRLILQPLVENAVRHGIGARSAAKVIEISATTSRNAVVVMVRDDGPGPSAVARPGGVGLRNTRERLAAVYGDAGCVTLEPAQGGGTVATVVMPLTA